ncbi:RING-type E3 ubiquitin transferase [Entomophthora muscae]|uniref:RING-type E3 ubiquitin transferase n=1 Tax=Entomophthora muscae TaxID=34485 RepID=A0ACC2SMH6_9FUNG|nr:RING-type E3 ubiquitin transferase [Entomophthora muscae]
MSGTWPKPCWFQVCTRRDTCQFYHDDDGPQVAAPEYEISYVPKEVRGQTPNLFYQNQREPCNRESSLQSYKPYYNPYSKGKQALRYSRNYRKNESFGSPEEGELSDHSFQITRQEKPFPSSEGYEKEPGDRNDSRDGYEQNYNHLRGSSTDDTIYEACPSFSKSYDNHNATDIYEGIPTLSPEKPQREDENPRQKIYSKAFQDIMPATGEQPQFFGCFYKEAICGICLKLPEVFGVLIFCDHTFCFDCIKDRYEQVGSTITYQKRISCPICRCTSANIIPSAVPFPRGGNSKKKMIEIYLQSISKQSCKHFMKSLTEGSPYCPFGNECLHAHPSDGLCSQQRFIFSASSDGQPSNSIAVLTTGYKARQSNISFDELLSRFDMQASSWMEEPTIDTEAKHESVALVEDSQDIEEVSPHAINSYDLTSFVSGGLGR